MGYTTDFSGSIEITPPLTPPELWLLNEFNQEEVTVNDQPNSYCQWVATKDGTGIEWDGGEKFYDSVKWMQLLIDNFIGSNPSQKEKYPFLTGHKLSGVINASGEDVNDIWALLVVGDIATEKAHIKQGESVCCPNCKTDFVP